MNLIKDMEFEKLVEKTESLSGTFFFEKADKNADSYFVEVKDMTSLNYGMELYDRVETPVELKNIFLEMWKGEDDKQMQDYATILSVAAFKNKDSGESEEKEISPYIYEF